MSKENNGGPAFPLDSIPENCPTVPTGMTLRDYFAAKAMQAIIAASGSNGCVDYTEDTVSASAYAMADAMLEARKK